MSRRTGPIRRLAALAAVTCLLAAAGQAPSSTAPPTSPASGQPGPALARLKARGHEAIQGRLAALAHLRAAVETARYLADGERLPLIAQVDAAVGGLQALDAELAAAESYNDAASKARAIVDDHRVFSVLVPKVHIVIAASVVREAVNQLQALEPRLAELVGRAPGEEQAVRQAQLDQAKETVLAVRSAVEPLPGQVIPVDAAGYPENRPVLEAATQALRDTHARLGQVPRNLHALADE